MASFATMDDVVNLYDENLVRDLLSDSDKPAPEPDLKTNTRANTLLEAAAGKILTAAHAGNNYTQDELMGLSGMSKAVVVMMNVQLFMALLMRRRPGRGFSAEEIKELEEQNKQWLTELQRGKQLFEVQRHEEASTPDVSTMSVVETINQNTIATRTRNFYPSPIQRLPLNRQGG